MGQRAAYVEDALLADRCVHGEQAAARELFRREQRRVHATLYRVIGHNRDMDDLLQETFLQVFQSLARYRAEARLSTWIDRIAVRVAYRYLQRKQTTVPLEILPDLPEPSDPPDQRALARDGMRRFYAAVDRLPAAARLAFILHELDGRSIAETAELTETSVTATKVRIWRARRALRKEAAGDSILADFLSEES